MPDEYFYILLRSLTSTEYKAHYMTSLLGTDREFNNSNYAPTRLRLLENAGYMQHFTKEAVFGDNNEIIEKTRTSLFFLPGSYVLDLEQMHRDTFIRKYPFSKKTVTNRLKRLTKRVLESPTITDYDSSYIKFDIKNVKYPHFDIVNDYYYANIYDSVAKIKTLDYIKLNLRSIGFTTNDSNIEINHIYSQNLIFKYFLAITTNKINDGLTTNESLEASKRIIDRVFFSDNRCSFTSSILYRFINRLDSVKDKSKYPIISSFCNSYDEAQTVLNDVLEQAVITLNSSIYKPNLTIQHISILIEAASNVTRFYPTRYQDNEFTNYGLILYESTQEIPIGTATTDLFSVISSHRLFKEIRELYKECASLIDLTKSHKTINNKLLLPNATKTPHIEKKKILRDKENACIYKANSELKEEYDINDNIAQISDSSSFGIAKDKFNDIKKRK